LHPTGREDAEVCTRHLRGLNKLSRDEMRIAHHADDIPKSTSAWGSSELRCGARRSKKMGAIHSSLRYDVRRGRALIITSILLCM
jgi:hypothetical protein